MNHAIIVTTKGNIKIDLFSDVPETIANFKMLAQMGYYNNTHFYRVEKYLIQAGNPNPEIKDKYTPAHIKYEPNYHRNGQYSVGMADGGIGTASTHFYINKGENNHFDGRYVVFGTVIKGMRNIWEITKDDLIKRIEIE